MEIINNNKGAKAPTKNNDMKKIKPLKWEKESFKAFDKYTSKWMWVSCRGRELRLGLYTIEAIEDEQNSAYYLQGGMKNKIKNKRFTTLESAQKYANKHYAKEVAKEFSTLEIKWDDYNEYNNQIYPSFRPSASTIMPWVSTIPLEDKSGYYFYARDYWNYHSSKREKLGIHAEREEVKKMAAKWYEEKLYSVFYE